MKKLSVLFLLSFILFYLTSCSCIRTANYLERPSDTNLEFWITENVKFDDLGDYFIEERTKYLFDFYGKGYEPFINDAGVWEDPKHCVKYSVSGYPDIRSRKTAITEIVITDPKITFYGISLNSKFDEFDKILKDRGYIITSSDDYMHVANKANIIISLSNKYLKIRASVYNFVGF